MPCARRLCATFLAAAAACAHAPPPPLATAHLVVKTSPRGVQAFVRATVAGAPMLLLVDTGASHSMLPSGFARVHALQIGRRSVAAEVIDANGSQSVLPRLPRVPVQFEGESTGGTIDFFMMPSAAVDVGILAPQNLLRRGWALVIDLEHEELRYEPEEAALGRVRAGGSALREVEFGGCLEEGLFSRSHRFVTATVDGVAAKMLIDTGAERTVLARNHPAIPSMMSKKGDERALVGVASLGAGLVVDDVSIGFAETPFVLPALVLPASFPCGHGLIGADVLRHCTVVWGWKSLWVACRAPPRG